MARRPHVFVKVSNALVQICSGRLVSTTTAHLQPVTCLVVDPADNFFLSGSSDAMVHVWALPTVLSFSPDTSRAPVHTLSTHRGPISSIVCGHGVSSANIAVSISADKSAIVWDYHSGQALRTYLLLEVPTAVTLDPADRGFHIAYGNGSLQTVDFFDEVQRSSSVDVLRDSITSHRPVQLSPKTRFSAESQKLGGALSLSLSWDGTTLISGHTSGKIATWDVAKRNYCSVVANLPGPVSNLQFLSPKGFLASPDTTFRIHTITKPKQDAALTTIDNTLVPANYTLNLQFTRPLRSSVISATERRSTTKGAFEEALTYPGFHTLMLEESLAELETWGAPSTRGSAPTADFMALPHDNDAYASSSYPETAELKELKKQLASLQRIQKVTFSQLSDLREEKQFFLSREEKRAERAKARAIKRMGITNGIGSHHAAEDVKMYESDDATSDSGSDSNIEADES